MKSHKKKNMRKKSLKVRLIKAGVIFLCAVAAACAVFFLFSPYISTILFPVKNVSFVGNRHLTDEELTSLAEITFQENLLTVSNMRLINHLQKSPWIRTVSVRKEFPDSIAFVVEEAVPFALLDVNGRLYLIDEHGDVLEELSSSSVPFLPIITGDPTRQREGFREALKLARLMNESGFSSGRGNVEIAARKPHEIVVTIDGMVVKIGEGGYEEKLSRFLQLEEEIKKLNVPVDYIDLRFAKKAIVKPMKDREMQ
jgi:cell division protein FtsQ